MNLAPYIAFVFGIALSELWQWSAWKAKQPHGSPWLGYWQGAGLPHLGMNALGDVIVCVLWSMGGLDKFVGLVSVAVPGASDWANVGLPFTPQVGIMVGCAADLFSDQIAFVLRKKFGSPTDPAPVAPAGGGT